MRGRPLLLRKEPRFLNYPNFRAKRQWYWTAAVAGIGGWETGQKKRTKANASLEDTATVCQHLCQLFKTQFFIFIMRSNLNAWHFLCGGLTLSPKILKWPLVCHWKATNLSVTTCDVSPVILPLAFQKQLLHLHHSQQINLCVLPDHRLLSVPPAQLLLPCHPSAHWSQPLEALWDSRMEFNKAFQTLLCCLNSALSHSLWYKR